MKLTWKQIEPFAKSPDPKARVILIYGPDSGLMKERANSIGKTIVNDLNDPFNVVSLSTEKIVEDPAIISDEANAISMMGGSRLIRISDGGDKLTPTLKSYLENPSAESLIVIEAGELGPKSSLRQLCEKQKNAAALPCYVEDERGISNLVKDTIRDAGHTIQSDALAWLSTAISGDRLRARSEIEKLILYAGQSPLNISLDDVQQACGNAGAQGLDDLVYAVGSGSTEKALKTYHKLLHEGVATVTVLRVLQMHFKKLHLVQSHIQKGLGVDESIKKLQPPLFFKLATPFKSQLNRWSITNLNKVLDRLADLEKQSKQTGTPVETLLAQALLSLSQKPQMRSSA